MKVAESDRLPAAVAAWREAHPRATLREIELAVDEQLAIVRAEMVSDLAQRSPLRDIADLPEEERPRCEHCQRPLVSRGKRRRTLTGPGDQKVSLDRSYAVCPRCDLGLFPLDKELGILPGSQVLPLLAEMEVRLGAWMPFAPVTEFLAETVRMTRSKPTVHRGTLGAGQSLVDAETKATAWLNTAVPESIGPAVAHQQISVDGAMVPLIGRWAEVRTVAIATIVATDAGPKATDLSYFSRKTDHVTFSQQATLETHRRATDKAGNVTAVVDGADWIQEFLDLQCPGATRIIDWAHSSS